MGFIVAGVFFVVAIVFYGIYLSRTKKAKGQLEEANQLHEKGEYNEAFSLYKEALWNAREKPIVELEIIEKLESLYRNRKIEFDSAVYKRLIEQYQVLSKKKSQKAMRGINEIMELKKEAIDRMPAI